MLDRGVINRFLTRYTSYRTLNGFHSRDEQRGEHRNPSLPGIKSKIYSQGSVATKDDQNVKSGSYACRQDQKSTAKTAVSP
jgi:hypothetical protein